MTTNPVAHTCSFTSTEFTKQQCIFFSLDFRHENTFSEVWRDGIGILKHETHPNITFVEVMNTRQYQKFCLMIVFMSWSQIPRYVLFFSVLLYPAEKKVKELKSKLKKPEQALFSSHFADPPSPPPLPIEVKQKHKIKRSDSGRLLIDTRHVYPLRKNVAARCSKANLSTGRTLIRRKVDCWMTFEEYERLTR